MPLLSPLTLGLALLTLLTAVSLALSFAASRRRHRADERWQREHPGYRLPPYRWSTRRIWLRRAAIRYRVRDGIPVIAYFFVFAFVGAYVAAALSAFVLAPPSGDDQVEGDVVAVSSCERNPAWALTAHRCAVEVTWDGEDTTETVTVAALEPATVENASRLVGDGGGAVPADRLDGPSAYWALVTIVAGGAWGVMLGSLHYPEHAAVRRLRDWPAY